MRIANSLNLPLAIPLKPQPTITAVMAKYCIWAKGRYSSDEAQTIRAALRTLKKLYGSTEAALFGPKAISTRESLWQNTLTPDS